MFHSFHLAVQNGRGTFWFLPRKYFDPNLTTICCEKQWTELHIMEFYSFYCVYYVYYLQFYTLFPAFEADGIQEVSGSIPLVSTTKNSEVSVFRTFSSQTECCVVEISGIEPLTS